LLSARIGSTVDIREAKGGLHTRILRAACAENAQTMTEYAAILTFVAAAGVTAWKLFGTAVLGLFQSVLNGY
jgi:Flp pilus assembly pilin Flp